MKTEIFIENNRLDILADESALLTYAIDDLTKFASRQTTFSKTIILPGTANNNKLFGHIFQVGNSNEYNSALPNFGYNFNASKSAACIIFQDNIQTFKGVLRLLEINSDAGKIEYEVSVFGDLFSLKVGLTSKLLTDLDFSAYDHVYNETNIVNSWDAAPGSGYYYPLIDYGNYSTNKHDWDIRTFRPALYVKEYIDKMFAAAGFRYNAPLFSTTRFKRLVIPHNKKNLTGVGDNLVTSTISVDTPDINDANFMLGGFSATDFILATPTTIQYTGSTAKYVEIIITISGNYSATAGAEFRLMRVAPSPSLINAQTLPPAPGSEAFTVNFDELVLVSPGDTIKLTGNSQGGDTFINDVAGSWVVKNQEGTTTININPGDTTQLNLTIPSNVRQIDFLLSIIQLFNLYVYEDKFDNRLINITPYIDFYGTDNTDSIDWTYKLNRDKKISLKPMSELNSKIYKFNYKDDTDYYNDLYKKRYGMSYGSHIYDSEFEFADASSSTDIIFSSTPLVGYSGEEKVYPTILKQSGSGADIKEEQVDCNIRILQTKKITGVSSWNMKNGDILIDTIDRYGYAGHYDDPDSPTNDLNFGALQELFFTLAAGNLSATQFNVYWSSYMAEITDKDSKLLTASFYLKPSDIFNLDFSKYITIDTVLFRLNKIEDYNMNKPEDCKCSLLKVNYTNY
jgi:hypothetical protein